jgi:hypothetical protein
LSGGPAQLSLSKKLVFVSGGPAEGLSNKLILVSGEPVELDMCARGITCQRAHPRSPQLADLDRLTFPRGDEISLDHYSYI